MIEIVQSVAALLLTVSILVTFHEYGHYRIGRLFNVKALRFSIGFGPALFRWTQGKGKDGTEFVIAALPLGGYVRFLDSRVDEVAEEERHLAFDAKPVWPRIAIVAAGPFANFLLAFFAYWLLYSTGVSGLIPVLGAPVEDSLAARSGFREGEEIIAIDGRETPTWQAVNIRLLERLGETGSIEFTVSRPGDGSTEVRTLAVSNWLAGAEAPDPMGDLGLIGWQLPLEARVGSLSAGSAAEKGGFREGDLIVAVAGEPVDDWYEFVELVQASPGIPLRFLILREGRQLELEVAPATRQVNAEVQGYLGVAPLAPPWPENRVRRTHHPVYYGWLPAATRTWEVTSFTFESIGKMLVGTISSTQLSGPITIAQVARLAAESGFESYLGLLALLSIAIGVLNLLPIPMLDGGHLLYFGVEAITGKPLPERIQQWGRELGAVAIFCLMLLAFYNDLARI